MPNIPTFINCYKSLHKFYIEFCLFYSKTMNISFNNIQNFRTFSKTFFT